MKNPDACASALNKDVDAMITALNSKELITKVTKNKLEALLNEERNNVTTVLKSLDSIQQMLKLMEKREMNDGWWINIIKLLRHNERTKTITARVKLASIKAIINKIRNMYNLVWTQSPPLLSTPLLPPLRQSPSSLAKDNIKKWKLTLDKVKEYIDNNNKKPSSLYENKEIKKLGIWLSYQNYNYKKKIRNMKNKIVRKLWEDFINDDKYKKYFICNKEVWKKKLEFVKKYIDKNKKRPPQTSKNKNIKKHGQWLNNQLNNYKNKQKTMSNKTIRHLWEDFINQYKIYFKTH
jgi:hypothetical protein